MIDKKRKVIITDSINPAKVAKYFTLIRDGMPLELDYLRNFDEWNLILQNPRFLSYMALTVYYAIIMKKKLTIHESKVITEKVWKMVVAALTDSSVNDLEEKSI